MKEINEIPNTIQGQVELLNRFGLDVLTARSRHEQGKPGEMPFLFDLVYWIADFLAGATPNASDLPYSEKRKVLVTLLLHLDYMGAVKAQGTNYTGGEVALVLGSPVKDQPNPELWLPDELLELPRPERMTGKPIDFKAIMGDTTDAFSRSVGAFSRLGDAGLEAVSVIGNMSDAIDRLGIYRLSKAVRRVWGLLWFVSLPVDLKVYGTVCKLIRMNDSGKTCYRYVVANQEADPTKTVNVFMSASHKVPYIAALRLKKVLRKEMIF